MCLTKKNKGVDIVELLYKTLLNLDWLALTFIIGAFCFYYGKATGELNTERKYENGFYRNEIR